MKKAVVMSVIVSFTVGSLFASSGGENRGELKKDSVESVREESVFQPSFDGVSDRIDVMYAGIQDSTAIISLTNSRGTSIQSSVVTGEANVVSFHVADLPAGIYNVMLVTDQEIRIKRIVVD